MVKHVTFNHYNMGSNPIGLNKFINNDYKLTGRLLIYHIRCADSNSASHI